MQHENHSSLPQPDAHGEAHSLRVAKHIRAEIDEAGGEISFARYMHEVLYASGLGYYAAGAAKFGAAGDFVTAPEVSSVFGRVLARQCVEALADIQHGAILEFGAGSGKLALDMLQTFESLDSMPVAYNILEVSADLRQRQESLLTANVPHLVDNVRWLSEMPANHSGVIVANEVLDALPVERFVKCAGNVEQVCVAYDGDGLKTIMRRAPDPLRSAVAGVERDLGAALADGYASEVSLAAPAWTEDLARCLQQGAAFLFDYGVSRREYYATNRSDGWLRCHFRHFAHNDPLLHPGIQDISAWVDFSAVAAAAVSSGMRVLGYENQSQFLMGGGLDIEMQSFADLPLPQQLELSNQIKTLTLPGEMGENFKCIALGCGDTIAPSAFSNADRTHTL